MDIQSIKINANSNATETISKVKTCISVLLPSSEQENFKIESVSGGYGNPITTIEYTSYDRNLNHAILSTLSSRLNHETKFQIADELEKRLDPKAILHLRFSKRSLTQNQIQLSSQSDSVRVLIKFSLNNHKWDIRKNLMELNEFLMYIGLVES